jgi:hypothetical protein
VEIVEIAWFTPYGAWPVTELHSTTGPPAVYSLSQDQIMTMQTVSLNKSHGSMQGVYKHASRETKTDMTFSVYVPPHQDGTTLSVVYYLSVLTCTHANVTEKVTSTVVHARNSD